MRLQIIDLSSISWKYNYISNTQKIYKILTTIGKNCKTSANSKIE